MLSVILLMMGGRVYAGPCPPGQILPETYLRARSLGFHTHVRAPGVSHGQAFSRETAKGSGLCAYPQMAVRSSPSLMSYTLLDQDRSRCFCFIAIKARLKWPRLAVTPDPPCLLPDCWEYRLALHNHLAMT